MNRPIGQLLEDALRLNEAERGELVDRLIASLDTDTDDESPWNDEHSEHLDEACRRPMPRTGAGRMILDEMDHPPEF
jgi:hypothetical protein